MKDLSGSRPATSHEEALMARTFTESSFLSLFLRFPYAAEKNDPDHEQHLSISYHVPGSGLGAVSPGWTGHGICLQRAHRLMEETEKRL